MVANAICQFLYHYNEADMLQCHNKKLKLKNMPILMDLPK